MFILQIGIGSAVITGIQAKRKETFITAFNGISDGQFPSPDTIKFLRNTDGFGPAHPGIPQVNQILNQQLSELNIQMFNARNGREFQMIQRTQGIILEKLDFIHSVSPQR